jgi:hypothetical protein
MPWEAFGNFYCSTSVQLRACTSELKTALGVMFAPFRHANPVAQSAVLAPVEFLVIPKLVVAPVLKNAQVPPQTWALDKGVVGFAVPPDTLNRFAVGAAEIVVLPAVWDG